MNDHFFIKSRKKRFFILRLFNWVPDRIMLKIQYRIKLGFWPNFKHPKRFTEKIQLYKINYRNSIMTTCVDKYDVREYVKNKGLGYILNDLYGVYESSSEIDFDKLPNSYVIKSTTGGGGLNVIIIKDKTKHSIKDIIEQIEKWPKHNKSYVSPGREWAYNGIKSSKIIIEKYLEDSEGSSCGISDYKMMFFNGVFKLLWIDKNRYINHKRGFWDQDLNFLPNVFSDHDTFDTPPSLPQNIHEMIKIGEKLSKDFPYARIDLYNIDNKTIKFGEITFYPWSGYVKFTPDSFDYELGKYFTLYQ